MSPSATKSLVSENPNRDGASAWYLSLSVVASCKSWRPLLTILYYIIWKNIKQNDRAALDLMCTKCEDEGKGKLWHRADGVRAVKQEDALRTNKTLVSPCIHVNLSASAHNVASLAVMKWPAVHDLQWASWSRCQLVLSRSTNYAVTSCWSAIGIQRWRIKTELSKKKKKRETLTVSGSQGQQVFILMLH